MADVALGVRGAEKDLVAGFGILGVITALLLVVHEGVGAAGACGSLGLAEQAQRVRISEGGQHTPVDEHIAPCEAVFLAVVPLRVLLVEVSGVLGIVGAARVGGRVVELAVALFLVVADLCRSDGENGRCVAFAHGFTSLAVKKKKGGPEPAPLRHSIVRPSVLSCLTAASIALMTLSSSTLKPFCFRKSMTYCFFSSPRPAPL